MKKDANPKTDKKKRDKKKKKKGPSLSTVILVLILMAGLGIMLYPTVSDYWNSFHQTKAIANYDNVIADMSEEEYAAMLEDARQYNEKLQKLQYPFTQYEQLADTYYSVLDVAGTGIIGYVTIGCINVELPIYHGTDDSILNVAAGHLEGTSLPVGGEGTHSVISAHRGLPSAKLFTNLDKLVVGDTFTITVLNQLLTYEVDQILIVEPAEVDALQAVSDADYVTLQTCTPYGINTHRLLVRGHRIENPAGTLYIRAEAVKLPVYIVMPAIIIPILFVLLVILLVRYRRKPSKITLRDIHPEQMEDLENEIKEEEP
ncbi:MAG: class C sortase [Lachnospiraceae bacterium]|jgi:sortase A|nr:class C sortase [Lachnospiraceae bacterium]